MKPNVNFDDPLVARAVSIYQEQMAKALDADERVENAVLPFYSVIKTRAEQTGSCVALHLNNTYFLLTASHVIEPIGESGVLIGTGDGQRLQALGGDRFSCPKGPSGTHIDDPIDASVFHIRSEVPAKIRAVALTLDDLALDNDTTPIPSVHGSVGFRANRTKRKGSQSYVQYELFPSAEYEENEYRALSLDRTVHLALVHENLGWTGRRWQTSPQPKGFSGGAIIRFKGLPIIPTAGYVSPIRPLLSAITIEQRRQKAGKPGALIGTRVSVHLGLIAKFLPELNAR